jgi:hypothetical protein
MTHQGTKQPRRPFPNGGRTVGIDWGSELFDLIDDVSELSRQHPVVLSEPGGGLSKARRPLHHLSQEPDRSLDFLDVKRQPVSEFA